MQSVSGSGAIYIHDRAMGTITATGGTPLQGVLSGDGSTFVEVAMCSNGGCGVRSFIGSVITDPTLVEIEPQCSFKAYDISSDGRYVVGDRYDAANGPCPQPEGLMRWDRNTKTFLKVPISSGLVPMTSISNDGRFVATNNQGLHTNVADLTTGVVQPAGVDASEHAGTGSDFAAAISGSGRYVAFTSYSKLVSGDTNDFGDVYTRYSMRPGVTGLSTAAFARDLAPGRDPHRHRAPLRAHRVRVGRRRHREFGDAHQPDEGTGGPLGQRDRAGRRTRCEGRQPRRLRPLGQHLRRLSHRQLT